MTGARPHQQAKRVKSHCLLLGRYSRKTAVSNTRFPPLPNAERQTKRPSTTQLGAAPATIAKMAEMKSETLNAMRRPIMSAERPQNRAPTSIPTYTAIVKPLWKDGWNSAAAFPAVMDCSKRIKESAAYPKLVRQKSLRWRFVQPISSIA